MSLQAPPHFLELFHPYTETEGQISVCVIDETTVRICPDGNGHVQRSERSLPVCSTGMCTKIIIRTKIVIIILIQGIYHKVLLPLAVTQGLNWTKSTTPLALVKVTDRNYYLTYSMLTKFINDRNQ